MVGKDTLYFHLAQKGAPGPTGPLIDYTPARYIVSKDNKMHFSTEFLFSTNSFRKSLGVLTSGLRILYLVWGHSIFT